MSGVVVATDAVWKRICLVGRDSQWWLGGVVMATDAARVCVCRVGRVGKEKRSVASA